MFLLFLSLRGIFPPGDIFFYETFEHFEESNWSTSSNKKYEGEWSVSQSFPPQGRDNETVLMQLERNKHYAISTPFNKPLVFNGKTLIFQYEFRAQHSFTCSGAYMKIFSSKNFDPTKMNDKTQWTILFGPDRCGEKQEIKLIFNLFNPKKKEMEERVLINPPRFPVDYANHLVTLIIRPNATFEIRLDNTQARAGSLCDDFNPPICPKQFVYDRNDRKPKDWDDNEYIYDYSVKKPESLNENEPETIVDEKSQKPDEWREDEPEMIPDFRAKEPDYWDESLLGEWKPPLIKNPKCRKGCGKYFRPFIKNPNHKEWSYPLIKNPNYKGKWMPKKIPNPNYYHVSNPSQLPTLTGLGFEIWCTNKLLAFTNILVAFNEEEIIRWNNMDFLPRRSVQVNSTMQESNKITQKEPMHFTIIIVTIIVAFVSCFTIMKLK